ncbi:MAG: DUF2165 family protein [Sulfitobacter sp.]
MEQMILIAQTASVGFLALWLTTGVRDNILYPMVNETFTAEVMDMARMRQDYPEAYAEVAHRRVVNRSLQKLAFRLVVVWEVLTTLALWAGVLALGAACLGWSELGSAKALSLGAALMFTATWAMFLIVGNHFSYWFGHEGAQNTHFQMTFWGLGTMIFLAVA